MNYDFHVRYLHYNIRVIFFFFFIQYKYNKTTVDRTNCTIPREIYTILAAIIMYLTERGWCLTHEIFIYAMKHHINCVIMIYTSVCDQLHIIA